jgi:aryl-alcohol dehydrogenase-like predicted oxidoreductase
LEPIYFFKSFGYHIPVIYESLKNLDIPVSRVVFGTAIRSMTGGEVPRDLLDSIYASGINTFDTAQSYGDAEESLGTWIKDRGLRDKTVILTKGGFYNKWRKRVRPYDIESDFETSLAKLGTDYVDIYLIHKDDPESPVGPIMELLDRFHREGRARVLGCSNWHWRRVEEANAYAREHSLEPFSVISPNYCLAVKQDAPESEGTTLTGEANKEAKAWFEAQGMPLFAYSCLGRGFFAGKIKGNEADKTAELLPPLTASEYAHPDNFERLRRTEILAAKKNATPAQIAFAWLFAQPLKVFPVTSPSNTAHLNETIAAMDIKLSAEEAAWLNLERETP